MTLRPASLNEFAGLPVRPRVVGQSKLDAILDGRVVVKQEDVHGIRVRVAEIDVTEKAKRLSSHLSRVRCEAVSDFESVLIGLMLR